MKLYSVILGFGFMLLAGVSSNLQKCEGRSGLTYCVYFHQNGTGEGGWYCSPGGDFGSCGGVTTCVPNA